MSSNPTTTPRRRIPRPVKAAAIGAAALTAAVALPAFALDRGGDVAQTTPDTTLATTVDRAVEQAAAEAQARYDAELAAAQQTWLAYVDGLDPAQKLDLYWQVWSEEERQAFTGMVDQINAQLAAEEAARQAAAAAAAARAAQASQARATTSAPAASSGSSHGSGVWDQLAQCEAGGNWGTSTGNGYSGGLQFANSTWSGFGGTAYAPSASQASREQQIAVAERVLASQGWGAWPGCSSKLGLR